MIGWNEELWAYVLLFHSQSSLGVSANTNTCIEQLQTETYRGAIKSYFLLYGLLVQCQFIPVHYVDGTPNLQSNNMMADGPSPDHLIQSSAIAPCKLIL